MRFFMRFLWNNFWRRKKEPEDLSWLDDDDLVEAFRDGYRKGLRQGLLCYLIVSLFVLMLAACLMTTGVHLLIGWWGSAPLAMLLSSVTVCLVVTVRVTWVNELDKFIEECVEEALANKRRKHREQQY